MSGFVSTPWGGPHPSPVTAVFLRGNSERSVRFASQLFGLRGRYDRPVNRNLRVVFSKQEGGLEYTEVARGTWVIGREPVLTGEPIPPEVLKGLEAQTPVACKKPKGTITYARGGVRYAMDFEANEVPAAGGA